MQIRNILFPFAAAAALTAIAPAQAYDYEALPVPPASRATGVNNAGTAIGFSFANGPPQAFVVENGNVSWFTYPGAPVTLATDINNAGAILGDYSATGSPMDARVFVRDQNGGFTSFHYPSPTALATFAGGINDWGDFVGYYLDGADGQFHGFVRYRNGTVQQIDHPSSNGLTVAEDIDNFRRIYGVYNDHQLGTPERSFRMRGGVFRDVTIGGMNATNLRAVNNFGHALCRAHPTANNAYEPGGTTVLKRWFRQTTIAFPNASRTEPGDVSDNGIIVGSFQPDPQSPPFAFIARRVRPGCGQ